MRRPGLSVIAEIKRASPSKGRFPVEIDAAALAAEYVAGGADAISVLTDEPFFAGSLADLEAVSRAAPTVPVLRKDFILDPYQVLEARAHGACAVLLIVAALEQSLLERLLASTGEWGLEALVEVHDEEELDRALSAGAALIGINNRDLRTFDVDLGVAERLPALASPGAVTVGESGIFTADDAARMARAGLDGILVGESLVLAPDRAGAIATLKGGGSMGGNGVPA
jgi:indole-3-glycerol phosphate synthase